MNVQEFYNEFYRDAEAGHTYIWTLPRKKTYLVHDAAEFELVAKNLDRETGVYFSVGLTEETFDNGKRAKAEDVIGIPALWCDIDIQSPGHKSDNLPPDIQAAKSLLPENLRPSIIVFTGGGIHAYWLFREILETRTREEKSFAQNLLQRLQGAIRAKATERGWIIDPTADLNRVLRVPGTVNRKPGVNKRCYVLETDFNGGKYNPGDFEFLPEVSAGTTPANRREGGFERRDTDGPAEYQIENCLFIKNWTEQYSRLPEPVWKAAAANLLRGVGGKELVIKLTKDWLREKYNERETQKKLDSFLQAPPQGCDHICQKLGFDCSQCKKPADLKTPNSWSTSPKHQAVAKIRRLSPPTIDEVFKPENLDAMISVAENYMGEFAAFKSECQRFRINLNDLSKALKQRKKERSASDETPKKTSLEVGDKLGDVTTKSILESCPVSLRIPPNFNFDKNGVTETRQTDYGVKEYTVTGNPIVITKRLSNIDTGEEKIELQFLHRFGWKNVVAKRSEIFSAQAIIKSLADQGLNLSSESAKRLVKFLQETERSNQDLIPYQNAISKIGWRGNNFDEFVLPSLPNNEYVIDAPDDGGVLEAYHTSGSYDEWLKLAKKIHGCGNRLVGSTAAAKFLFASTFAPPLLKILHERNFMVYLWGNSGGGKTAILNFAQSAWGDPENLIRSFYATMNGIERSAEYSNDMPLAINERQVMTGGANKQEALEALVYMLEGGRGKARATPNGLRKTATWRLITQATGEEPIAQDHSLAGVRTRIVELKMPGNYFVSDSLSKEIYALARQNYGHAGVKFMERLTQENKNGFDIVYDTRKRLLADIEKNSYNLLDPHVDAISLICTAEYLINIWLFEMPEDFAYIEAQGLACSIASMMPTRAELSDIKREYDMTVTWIAGHEKYFDGSDENMRESGGKVKGSETYGFYRNSRCYIFKSCLDFAWTSAKLKPKKVIADLAEAGYVFTDFDGSKKRLTTYIRYKGQKVATYAFRADLEKIDAPASDPAGDK